MNIVALRKTNIFTIILVLQSFILIVQTQNAISYPQYSRYSYYRRQPQDNKQNSLNGYQQQRKPSTNRRNDRPNSYYTRLLSSTTPSPEEQRIARRVKYEKKIRDQEKAFQNRYQGNGIFNGIRNSFGSIFGYDDNSYNRRRRPVITNPCRYRNNYNRNYKNANEQERFFAFHYHHHGGGYGNYYGDNDSVANDDCNSDTGLYSDSGSVQRPQTYLEVLANGGQGIRQKPPRRRRPRPTYPPASNGNGSGGDSDSDVYDPVFDDNRPVYENDENGITGPALSPGQLVGGVAHTVNGIIQTLAGNTG